MRRRGVSRYIVRSGESFSGEALASLGLLALVLTLVLQILALVSGSARADDGKPAEVGTGPESERVERAEKTEQADRGRAMQRRVYSEIPADDPWLQMSQEQVFAQIWTRPGLSMRDRRLISLTAAAYAASPPGYISHIEGALDKGDLTPAELWEWLIHFTNYAGYPKAAPVWAEIRIALARRGVLPLPESLGPGRDPELDRERAKPDGGQVGK
jgi:alkylhydroperoxidase/carboxymuconolactone decarboxylase family protein YurZ